MNARKEAFATGVHPPVLERIRRPLDMQIQGKEHTKAIEDLNEWTNKTSVDVLRCELATHAKFTKGGDLEREVIDEESLKKLTFDSIAEEVQENAPTLYNTLLSICESPRNKKNIQKESKFQIVGHTPNHCPRLSTLA
ncbi:unnamed protein product [Rhizoctonia solani]|uniref:Uncharacterized protein n=1 Tax=Rhizoctonia solani TaxID=456999 RepID=A0A8H2Y325_9AGAM|nr:unnamed protein product [Rhizoctonia solani]